MSEAKSYPERKLKVIGTSPVRPDGVPKVTGLAKYGADFTLPGMLWGKILRSPHAHARIRSIDTSKAQALRGVKAVMTAADLPDQKFAYVGPERVAQNFWHMTRNIMAREKVLYEGHAVAAVAATTPAIAEEALKLIEVDYEVLPHVIDVDEAMKPDCAAPVRGHDHARHRPRAQAGLEHLQEDRVQARRHRSRVHCVRRDRGDEFQDRAGPSGLYRTARLPCSHRRGWPGGAVGIEPGTLRRTHDGVASARHESRRSARARGRDRRRLRRQDCRLRRTRRGRAVAQVRPSRENNDEPRGRVQGARGRPPARR